MTKKKKKTSKSSRATASQKSSTAKSATPQNTKTQGVRIHCAFDELIDTMALVAHPKNPNKHPEEQIEKLKALIEQLGFRLPITVSKLSGYIIRGHCRWEAAKRLGMEKVPIDYQEYASEAEEMTDLIADKVIPELSVWDKDALTANLSELEAQQIDLELTGLTEAELQELQTGGLDSLYEETNLQPIEIKDPPKMAWVLIGIPTVRYGEVAETIENIADKSGILCETVLNDQET